MAGTAGPRGGVAAGTTGPRERGCWGGGLVGGTADGGAPCDLVSESPGGGVLAGGGGLVCGCGLDGIWGPAPEVTVRFKKRILAKMNYRRSSKGFKRARIRSKTAPGGWS